MRRALAALRCRYNLPLLCHGGHEMRNIVLHAMSVALYSLGHVARNIALHRKSYAFRERFVRMLRPFLIAGLSA